MRFEVAKAGPCSRTEWRNGNRDIYANTARDAGRARFLPCFVPVQAYDLIIALDNEAVTQGVITDIVDRRLLPLHLVPPEEHLRSHN